MSTRTTDGLRAGDSRSAATSSSSTKAGAIAGWVDDRTGLAKGARYIMSKVFPDHWSFMLGEVAMYSMIITLITGVFLTFWFVPSAGHVEYNGSYIPLKGVQMSEAYASTLHISFDVRGGLLIRQIHHWGALLFVVAIVCHMFRVFFTGAYRKPREINWLIGTMLAMLALIEGFAGYSLPDDLLSGTGLRAAQGFMLTIPVIGSYFVYFLFGGTFPGEAIIPRLYSVHILLLPAIIVGLFAAHLILVMVHKHTQYPGPGRTNENVVGFRLMPVYTAKAGGFFFIVFGIIALISSLFSINSIWNYGPYDPTAVTAGSQPDWYMGFADGALRLMPGWTEVSFGGFTFTYGILLGSLVLLPLVYVLMGAYPFVEQWITGDQREHHLLERPRNADTRTAIGVAAITAYCVLWFAAGNDIIATHLSLSINDITWFFRILFFVGPLLAFWVTKRICLALQRADREKVLHGRETGEIVRTADGRFYERHEPLDEYTRWHLVTGEPPVALALDSGTDHNGVRRPASKSERRRAKWARFFYKDNIPPVTPAELIAAQHDGHGHEAVAEIESGETTSRH
ncbi:ubiquinol-cytochrome c reductase cytochrome b subunit [Arsenicicoccus piscis]|uniref:Cytochrome bc1 complex cytochrome b subunit n=1 Tax=Arsenicicoccus piscis TaxID=673954 RepID=A0ABQ6HP06_9MICO|nr:ubiquinol-cytochrome c reductase cytochrome b subunit [Arsenicicoccus piscis]MCH8628663.1 ubiquinol-cytochrome c reductase cytochrome b subunit [Arsenicicoccus piscis]GMA19403.1 cytochrome bc1 complex cytochrome b subunit [Arsenicicoccus piscis]